MERKQNIVYKCIVLIAAISMSISISAQNSQIVNRYVDSLKVARNQISTSTLSPYFFQAFYPTTFYSNAAKSTFTLSDNPFYNLNYQLLVMYVNHPSIVVHHENEFANEDIVTATETTNDPTDQIKKELDETIKETGIDDKVDVDDIGLTVKRPNFWTKKGNFSLKFSQNYFSENWYKGGNNNQTMLTTLILRLNYNDTKKISWENTLDMRLGFVTTTSDTCHTFLTNNDKIQLNTKLGIKATKSWYYTVSGEAKTQFLPGYKTNNKKKFSDFCSPLDVSASLGMDFKPQMKNGNSLSVILSPLSYKLRFIGSHDNNIHKNYRFVGRHSTQDYGSRVEFNCNFKLFKNLTWRSKLYAFTSYEYVESEFENVFKFAFSKYISTELYTLWRFDDNRGKKYYDDNLGYFQFKEYLTIGLDYSF